MPLVPGRRRVLSACAKILSAALVTLATLTTPSFAATSRQIGSSLTLVAQSNDVVGTGKFSFAVHVQSNELSRDLRVQVTLFPKLDNRSDFNASLNNVEPQGGACLDKTGNMTLTSNPGPANGITHFKLSVEATGNDSPCATASKDLTLGCVPGSCGGVYPMQVSLIDRQNDATLATFTTHLVELDSGSPAFPLNVGLVLSLGSSLDIGPGGRSTLNAAKLAALSQTLTTISSYPHLHLTLAIYPQLLLALAETKPIPSRLIGQLLRLVASHFAAHTIELTDTPFFPLDTSALATEGAGTTFDQLLEQATSTASKKFGRAAAGGPYFAPAMLSNAGAQLLAAACISQVVLQPGAAPPTSNGFTQTAPLNLAEDLKACGGTGSQTTPTRMDAFVADPAGAFLTTPGGAPVLAAHRLLADLAQIYFEEPNASPRSVVITENGDVNPELLNVVLNGLNSNAYVKSSTVGQLFAINSSAGSTATPLSLPNTVTTTNALSIKAISEATNELGVISSVVPSNTALLSTLNNDLTFAKAYGLSPRTAARYLNAPSDELAAIAKSLAFLGKRFTLTAATGKIPITIQQSAGVGPIDVVIRLESSNLVVLHGSGTPESLQSDATTLSDVEVDTEGSGVKTLIVKVVSPKGNDVLLRAEFKVYSTAISGVAVALSIFSLVILGAWWLRSARRKRRGKAHALTKP